MTVSREHLTDREIAAFWQQVAGRPAPARRPANRLMVIAWCTALAIVTCTYLALLWTIDTLGR